jgi:hypothetical protein
VVRFRRDEEAAALAKNNQIISLSRLLAGQLDNWDEFLSSTDAATLAEIDRRQIKSQLAESTALVRKLLKEFNRFFLHEASERVFLALFHDVKAGIPYGLRLPILEFEKRFTPVRREVESGRDQRRPYHATICITLTGLTYVYPEWHFSQDISTAFTEARHLQTQLGEVENDPTAKRRFLELRDSAARQASLHRWCIIACFSVIEAYLSGLAWRYQQTEAGQLPLLSAKDRKTIEDSGCTFRDRLIRIPKIVTGRVLWEENDRDVDAILGVKHIRDALMHPSPFSQPDKYGGRDKLAVIYNLDQAEVEKCLRNTVSALRRISQHIYGSDAQLPEWLADLNKLANRT